TWGRVFIFGQLPDRSTKVFTARSGRIDSSGTQAELVLSDVLSAQFPNSIAEADQAEQPATSSIVGNTQKSYVVERSAQLRFSINTGRAEVMQQLNQPDKN